MEFGPLKVTLVEEKADSVTPSILVRDFNIEYEKKVCMFSTQQLKLCFLAMDLKVVQSV